MEPEGARRSVVEGLRNWSAARWREYGFRLVLELLVVFVGVYGASAFAEHQKARELEARRQQIRRALIEEIETITRNARGFAGELRVMLAASKAAADSQSYVPLTPFLNPQNPRVDMWEAALRAGGLDLFDVPTFWRISRFYTEVNQGLAQIAQLRDLSERMLLPVAGSGVGEYYDPRTGDVRPRYAWYFAGMQNLVTIVNSVTPLGDSLVAELRQRGGGVAGSAGPRDPQ